jgi:hypothetical protein
MNEDSGEDHLTHKQKQENRIVERVMARLEKSQLEASANPESDEMGRFVQFMESTRVLAGSALLAAMLGAVYEYLALMGVADVSPARLVLLCAILFGSLFCWELAGILSFRKGRKALAIMGATLLLIVAAVSLDRWAVRWQKAHPPEFAAVANEVHGIHASMQQLAENSGPSQVTHDAPEVKEIQPVPGYLKLDLRYDHLPLEKAGEKAIFNLYYFNRGSSYVHNATEKGSFYYMDFHGVRPPMSDPDIAKTLYGAFASMPSMRGQDIGPGDALWTTYQSNEITDDMYQAIQAGTARLYVVAHAEWETRGVPDHVDTCDWLQPSTWDKRPNADPTKTRPVWHIC